MSVPRNGQWKMSYARRSQYRTAYRRRAGALAAGAMETWTLLCRRPGGAKACARAAGPKSRALETDASRLKGRHHGGCNALASGLWRLADDEPSGSTQVAAKPDRGCSLADSDERAEVKFRRNGDVTS